MAAADDINSTLQLIARQMGQQSKGQSAASAFSIGSTLGVGNIGSAASVAVVGANAGRSVLLFHNPGDSVPLLIAPATDANGAPLTVTFSSRAGGYLLLPQDYLFLTGINTQLAWNVIAQSGTTNNPITVGSG